MNYKIAKISKSTVGNIFSNICLLGTIKIAVFSRKYCFLSAFKLFCKHLYCILNDVIFQLTFQVCYATAVFLTLEMRIGI